MISVNINLKELYEKDFNLWIEMTQKQIKEKSFDEVDWENLLEELESLGKQQKQELENRLIVLLEHLLKLSYWESEKLQNARGWQGTIIEQRKQILRLLKKNPSLKPYLSEILTECYQDARDIVLVKTGLDQEVIPREISFDSIQVLDETWLPD